MKNETKYQDQTCDRCGAKVTAKELRKGARQFYEFMLLDLTWLSRSYRMFLCTTCQVNQERFYQMKPFIPETNQRGPQA